MAKGNIIEPDDDDKNVTVIDQGYAIGNRSTIVISSFGKDSASIRQDKDTILISKENIPAVIKALKRAQ